MSATHGTDPHGGADISEIAADVVSGLQPLLTFKEAADVLRVSMSTIHRYTARGLLRTIRHGHSGSARVLVPRTEIARYLSAKGIR